MNPPQIMGEKVDINPPWKGGVMMRISLMTVMLYYERVQVRLEDVDKVQHSLMDNSILS